MNTAQNAPVTRTWRLRAGTVSALDAAVERLKIPQSHLVDALLDFALSAELEGRLVITRRPTAFEVERVYSAH